MALITRLTMSVALVAAAAAATSAAAPPSAEQHKRDVIRDVLPSMEHAAPDWVILQAGTRASALSAVAVNATPEQTIMSLTLDRNVLALVDYENPKRILLDLQPAIPVTASDLKIARDGILRHAAVTLHAVEPHFITRIALDTTSPAVVTFKRTGTSLDVILAQASNEPADALNQKIDALLAREQAQLAVRQSAYEEMCARLDVMYNEHSRFLSQAIDNLERSLHECKLVQVQNRLDTSVPASKNGAAANWSKHVADLDVFLKQASAERESLNSGMKAYLEASATAMRDLSAKTEAACERHAAASVASAALGTLANVEKQISGTIAAHQAAFETIVNDHDAFMAKTNSAFASLRDFALAHQQEAGSLLQAVPVAKDMQAAPKQPSTTADALDTIMHLNQPLKAVADTSPDFSHEPKRVAALDDSAADTTPPPPGKRDGSPVQTQEAEPVETPSAISSRMQTIFPEIAESPAALEHESPHVLGAVESMASETATQAPPTYSGDPLDQLVNIDFREMELSHVVSILAKKAQINVIAGTDITGTVTANLRNVPLRQAMETALRMNGLGMIEEDGIFRIVPYEDAVAARRATRMLYLNNAQADEVKKTLDDVLVGSPDAALMAISANPSTNVIILSGPADTVDEFEQMVRNLDVAEPTLPTATRAFRLNYAEPSDVAKVVQSVLTAEVGQVATDDRSRQIIVTDIPIVIEQVAQLITDIDLPVKQVAIEAMVVDAVLTDSAQTGTEWIAQAIRRQSRRGDLIGNLSDLALDTDLGIGDDAVGTLSFGILSSEINVQATIAAEVSHGNAQLLTNPQVVTIENQLAKISIAQEIPYREIRQSEAGGTQTTTSFKEVGTVLEVTPRVTHEDDVIVKIEVKQSDTKGEFEGIPIEDKREAGTTLRARDGQTIFIGGLRKFDDTQTIRKVPFLGDIPVANFLFRSNVNGTEINELMIFLTCHVLQEHVPDLTPYQQMKYDELGGTPLVPTTERDVMGNIVHPGRVREPFWKWRRQK